MGPQAITTSWWTAFFGARKAIQYQAVGWDSKVPLIPIPLFSYFWLLVSQPSVLLIYSPTVQIPVLTWTIAVQISCMAKIIFKLLFLHVQCALYALSSMDFESAHEHDEHTCTCSCSLGHCSSRAIHTLKSTHNLQSVFHEKTNLHHILAALTHYTCTVPLVELGDLWRRYFPARTHTS